VISAIAVILRHGSEHQRTLCNFGTWTVADVGLYKKAVLWQRNRTICKHILYNNVDLTQK